MDWILVWSKARKPHAGFGYFLHSHDDAFQELKPPKDTKPHYGIVVPQGMKWLKINRKLAIYTQARRVKVAGLPCSLNS